MRVLRVSERISTGVKCPHGVTRTCALMEPDLTTCEPYSQRSCFAIEDSLLAPAYQCGDLPDSQRDNTLRFGRVRYWVRAAGSSRPVLAHVQLFAHIGTDAFKARFPRKECPWVPQHTVMIDDSLTAYLPVEQTARDACLFPHPQLRPRELGFLVCLASHSWSLR